MLDLSIVIVNHNTRQLLLDCLDSIFGQSHAIQYEVIVVDNESSDGSAEAVRNQYPQVRLIVNPIGRYFSGGNNQGIAIAEGRYILALNPDTVVLGNCLTQLVEQMDSRPEIGMATTLQFWPDKRLLDNGSRQTTFGYLLFQYTFLGKLLPRQLQRYRDWLWYAGWNRHMEQEVGVLPGSCMIANRETWQAVNGFPEQLPIYFSEDWIGLQVQRLGKKNVHLVTDGIIHYEGAATYATGKRQLSKRYLTLYLGALLTFTHMRFGRIAQGVMALLLLPNFLMMRLMAK